jgi:hypothetical protein
MYRHFFFQSWAINILGQQGENERLYLFISFSLFNFSVSSIYKVEILLHGFYTTAVLIFIILPLYSWLTKIVASPK